MNDRRDALITLGLIGIGAVALLSRKILGKPIDLAKKEIVKEKTITEISSKEIIKAKDIQFKDLSAGVFAVGGGAVVTKNDFAQFTADKDYRLLYGRFYVLFADNTEMEADLFLGYENTRALCLGNMKRTIGRFSVHKHSDAPYIDSKLYDWTNVNLIIEKGEILRGNGEVRNLGAGGTTSDLAIELYMTPKGVV